MAVAAATQPDTSQTEQRRLTTADLDLVHAVREGDRVDLIGGEVFVTPAPDRDHQSALRNFLALILAALRANPSGEVWFAPYDVRLSAHDVVQPDILYLSRERLGLSTQRGVLGAPDLVVEALSPATRDLDLGARRELYERSGVREYWVLDPRARTATLLRLADGRFAEAASDDGLVRSEVVPGLVVDPADVFADLPGDEA